MNYEQLFASAKQRLIGDLGHSFSPALLDQLSLSWSYSDQPILSNRDEYRSKTSKIPAYYNPNTHTVHLDVSILKQTDQNTVENIYYHELVHASSHHARIIDNGRKILKSGLKIQMWDQDNCQTTLHRGLNEGLTQYLANSYTDAGPAYKNEVAIIGRITGLIGLRALKNAYFGPAINQLEQYIDAKFGAGAFYRLSSLTDQKDFTTIAALIT